MSGRPDVAYGERRTARFIPAADDSPRPPGEHPGMASNVAPSSLERRAVRATLLGFAVTVLVAVAALLGARAAARDLDPGSPGGTVRDFLVTAVAESNGVGACTYLTAHAIRQVAAVEPPHTGCHAALTSAGLTLGSRTVGLESTIKGLTYHVEQRGDRASVTIEDDGATHTFALRRATPSERREFMPPATSWRIDSGVAPLVR
jgi:hypothetical protein